jgi:hypothetical protein
MVTFQSQTQGMRSVAKRIRPMRRLPSNTAKSLRPIERSFSIGGSWKRTTPHQPNILAEAALVH